MAEPLAPSTFVVDLEGFEGPIDLLLTLAREQKVDLKRISILTLADQYLAFIQNARELRLEIAADYLVTAAWLCYLKSRLLLPEPPPGEEPSADELAANLAHRLSHLDAIRRAGAALMERPQLGAARLARGAPEGLEVVRLSRFRLSLHELVQAYLDHRLKDGQHRFVYEPAPVIRIDEALRRLTRLLGGPDWQNLMAFLPPGLGDPTLQRSAMAASLAAGLELARDGVIELNQAVPFGPIYVRRRR
jgi:segregation and condensation protein A